LSNKLAVTQESLDTTRRDNEELKSRMSDLQSQLDKLQRLIELKNNQLAKMQAEGAGAAPAANAAVPLRCRQSPQNWRHTASHSGRSGSRPQNRRLRHRQKHRLNQWSSPSLPP
jgi:Tfp pilus assembly protein FimV